ncbi:MAG: DUF4350 domain-containing protein [Firmicutes bacterium]|nr:DUF4350 domain-containing protein [Bacillota bacterium]
MDKVKNALLVIAALVVLAAGGVIAAFLFWESGGRSRPYSSHSTVPRGSKAFFLLLEESGHPVQRWNYPLTMLKNRGEKGVLIITEPVRRPLPSLEAEAARDWVEEGNRLILLGQEQHSLFEAFDLELTATNYFSKAVLIEPESAHPFLEGVCRLEFHRGGSFTAESGGIVLAGEGENSCILWKRAGAGEIISIIDPGFITNEALGRADNLIFLLNAAGIFHEPPCIFIDEYHHGFGPERPIRDPSAGPAVITYLSWPAGQLALFTLLLLFTLGTRFGAPRPLPGPSPRALSHTIAAAAAIYRRAGARRAAFAYLHAGLKRRLLRKYRLSYDAGPGEIAALGERAAGLEKEMVEADFRRFAAVSGGKKITAAELLDLSRRIDCYRKEFNL